jgi:hypothetical protein
MSLERGIARVIEKYIEKQKSLSEKLEDAFEKAKKPTATLKPVKSLVEKAQAAHLKVLESIAKWEADHEK